MSKRPIAAEGPGPTLNNPQPSTIPRNEVLRSDPPLKLPKLATPPVVPGEETIHLDKIPKPELSKVSMTESVSCSKNEDHANKEEAVQSKSPANVPEGERKNPEETLKNSVKRQSWASSYLSSIGISSRKPIKINLSSSMKNVATMELNQSNNSTEEKKPESKNANEHPSQLSCDSAVTVNVPPSIPIYSPGLKKHIENNFKPKTDFNDIGSLFIPKPNLLPYIDRIHPETLQIGNEKLPYLNCCSRHHHGDQTFYETSPFTEFDRYQNLSCYRPEEDKSYLDKVDQFLAKISKDKSELESHNDIDARKRPLSLNHREVENNMKYNVTNRLETRMADHESVRRCNDLLVNKYKEFELKEKEFLKMSKRFCDAAINEKPTTSKQSYVFKEKNYEKSLRYRSENIRFEDEYKTRESKTIHYNNNRAEYFRPRSPNHAYRYQEIGAYKTRQRSNSSSGSERGRSPINNKEKTIKKYKRVKSESIKRFENDQESTLPLQYKKSDKSRQSRESSNSSSHKSWDKSARHIPNNNKHKPYTENRARSNSKSSCDFEKPRERPSCPTQISRESRSTIKRKKSYSSSDTSPCHHCTSKGNKRYKLKRGSSSSSSSSNDSVLQDTSFCQSHKTFANKKDVTKNVMKEKYNSKDYSENFGTRTRSDTVKCRDKKSKIKEKCDKSCSIKNKSPLSPDAKKTYKLIKDIISKDKVKRKLIKSLISHNSSINFDAKDKCSKTSPASNSKQRTKILGPSEICGTNTHNRDEESKSSQSVLVKSAVLLKDNIEQRRGTNFHEIEKDSFDLRSKLSRKNLSQHINKIRNKKHFEKEEQARKKLVVTVDNQDQETIKTDSEKQINQEETEKLKAKKFKKIKLVINVICKNSDDEDNVIEAHREGNGDDTDVGKECALSNEELSFLDDLNIDEIVDSLTHNKKELGLSKNCSDDIIENKILIDLCDLISTTENSEESDASTVHLEELCERNDNFKKSNKIKKGGDSSKSNVLQNERIVESSEKSKLKDKAQSTVNANDVTLTSDQILVSERKIKQEVEDSDNDDANKQNLETKSPTYVNNVVADKIKMKEANITFNVKEIKNDLVNKDLDKEIKIEEISDRETDRNTIFSSTLKDKKETNDNYKECVMPLTEIKDETVDLDVDNITPVIEIKDEPIDLDVDNPTSVVEIKDEPMDKSKEINLLENETNYLIEESVPIDELTLMTDENSNKQSSATSSLQVMKNSVTCTRNGNKKIMDNTPAVEVEEKPIDEILKLERNKQTSEHELVPANKIKTVVRDEDVNKILSYKISPQTKINHVSLPRDKNEAIIKSYSKENIKVGKIIYDSKNDIEGALIQNNNKMTENFDTFQNKSPMINIEKVITNQQNISTETIEKVTKLNESFIRNSVTKPDRVNLTATLFSNTDLKNLNSVGKTDNKSDVTSTTIFSNQSTISDDCFTEITDSGNLNNSDLSRPREISLDLLNKVTVNSATDASTYTEQSQEEEKAAKNNALIIKPTKKINDNKDSESSKRNNPQNINMNDVNDDPKSDKKKDTFINNQQSKNIEKYNFAKTDTIIKSRSHSPVRIETTTPVIKTERKPGFQGKSFVQNLEDRLLQHLHEPFTVNSLIHKGKFSKLFHCKSSLGENYVIKSLRFEKDCCARGKSRQKLLESLQMGIPNESLNFVCAIDGLAVAGLWCILMDFYPKNLSQCLQEYGKSLHVNHVQLLSRQLVAAVSVLRLKNVVHSDIKPGHILLNSTNDRLKLCGFDSAHHIGQVDVLPNIGSVNYRAPEIILGHSAGYSVDVWSTALVMFEMATKRQLFPGCFNNDILFKQMCTVGYVPRDMLDQSRFGYNHFSGTQFRRRNIQQPQNYLFYDETKIYKNNILRSTVNVAYLKAWGKGIPRKQKVEELSMIDSFCNLLEEMLTIHPVNRLPIEFVYSNPYMLDVSQGCYSM